MRRVRLAKKGCGTIAALRPGCIDDAELAGMDKFVVTGWTDERAWASKSSWSRSNLEQRIAACTTLRGTHLKRFVRRGASVTFMEE